MLDSPFVCEAIKLGSVRWSSPLDITAHAIRATGAVVVTDTPFPELITTRQR
jgi:hypothetical protein